MSVVVNKRSMMILYSGKQDYYSHLVRLVLAEKAIPVDIIYLDPADLPEELLSLNPYHSLPTLVDRDLALYHPQSIIEYFDERYPHPPLLPGYPVARAECRMMIHRIERDWYSVMHFITHATKEKEISKARQHLKDSICSVDPVFQHRKYFMGDEYTLVDCMMIPLLWRLSMLGIEVPKQAKGLQKYIKRLFAREAMQASLSDVERELADPLVMAE